MLWTVLQILKSPPSGSLTVCWPQAWRSHISWNQKVNDVVSQLHHHQPIRSKSMSWSRPAPWTLWDSSLPLQGETHSLEGISQVWPPLPGKTIKLFKMYFYWSVIKLQFCINYCFSIMVYHRKLNRVPCTVSRTLLFIHSIPVCIQPSPTCFLLDNHQPILYVPDSVSVS